MTPIAPVASPFATPQSTSSCHGACICVVSVELIAIVPSAITITRRMPKRSYRPAANGPPRPYSTRLIATAAEIVARDQPNSSCSGTINTPTVDRNPAAVTSVRNETAAITQP